jgi:putative ABC transport system substrate-binding protein
MTKVKRRSFLTLLGGAAGAWPIAARAQQASGRTRRVGALIAQFETSAVGKAYAAAFEHGLTKRGWTIGRDLVIDYRWNIADPETARIATADLLRIGPDAILAHAIAAMNSVQQATRTVPVVFTGISEPVTRGYVASLARPGGNVTGFTNIEPSITGKLVELLKQIAPHTIRVAFMFSRAHDPVTALFERSAETAAVQFGLQFITVQVNEPEDIEAAFAKLGGEPGSALIVPPDTFVSYHHQLVAEQAARHKVPSIYALPFYIPVGGLIYYGPNVVDEFRRAAEYVDRILRGEKPADLAVQQPNKFDLAINLKTAHALGLEVPANLLALTDQVVE